MPNAAINAEFNEKQEGGSGRAEEGREREQTDMQ